MSLLHELLIKIFKLAVVDISVKTTDDVKVYYTFHKSCIYFNIYRLASTALRFRVTYSSTHYDCL